jgi:hypothetical protein
MPTSSELITESLKCPLSGIANPTMKPPVAVQLTTIATVLEESYWLIPTVAGHQPVYLLMVATAPAAPAVTAISSLTAILEAEAATAGAPRMGLAEELGAEATVAAEATRTATPPVYHAAALMPAKKSKNYYTKKSSTARDNNGFPAFSTWLRNLLAPEKFKPLGITKYNAKQDPIQWLRCYALSIENAGGNNDTKCLYFPFCLDQAPLTWLESLEKYSIDKWDQLKEQFTSNFAGSMGRLGTRMDLAMVEQE